MRTRLALVNLLVTVLMATILGRLWFVQIADGGAYVRTAGANHIRQVLVPAPRGRILDREGRILAGTRNRLVAAADYHAIRGSPDGGRATLKRLAALLRKPASGKATPQSTSYKSLAERLRLCGPTVKAPCWAGSPYEPIPLAERLDTRTALQITERPEDFPGITAEMVPVREYPLGTAAAQLIGYLQPGLGGRDGVEARYDASLKGTPGRRELVVSSDGDIMRVARETPPEPGDNVVTSLDTRIQELAYGVLKRGRSGEGTAVVLEAKTGRIVAMASRPAYDPAVWGDGISTREYKTLDSELLNRSIQGQWAPGSTWKITSVAAAMRDGREAMRRYGCPGSYPVGGRSFRNYRGIGLGSLNLEDALTRSCDTVFYRFAYEMWLADGGLHPKKKTKDPMQRTARAFGFGAKTGIDLPGEVAGRVPDRKWKDPWWAGDAANFAIGQGDVLVTPLQLARAYAAVANGGKLFSPRVGHEIVDAAGDVVRTVKPPVTGRLPTTKKQLRHIQNGLRDVPRRGTAAGAFQGFPLDKVSVSGKTGTAEVAGKKDTSWFVGFTSRYVVVVTLPESGTGSQAAAPAVRKILEGIYEAP